jgi:hypothetical protein
MLQNYDTCGSVCLFFFPFSWYQKLIKSSQIYTRKKIQKIPQFLSKNGEIFQKKTLACNFHFFNCQILVIIIIIIIIIICILWNIAISARLKILKRKEKYNTVMDWKIIKMMKLEMHSSVY